LDRAQYEVTVDHFPTVMQHQLNLKSQHRTLEACKPETILPPGGSFQRLEAVDVGTWKMKHRILRPSRRYCMECFALASDTLVSFDENFRTQVSGLFVDFC
jgi:hypothetical protein